MLVLLGGCFMRGFKEVIGLAVGIVGVYLALNALVHRQRAGLSGRPPGAVPRLVRTI